MSSELQKTQKEFAEFKIKIEQAWKSHGEKEAKANGDSKSLWIADNYGQQYENYRQRIAQLKKLSESTISKLQQILNENKNPRWRDTYHSE